MKKGIIDTKGTEYYIWERNKLCSGGGGVLDIILKTSDNILDLVEVGEGIWLKNTYGIVAMVVTFGLMVKVAKMKEFLNVVMLIL